VHFCLPYASFLELLEKMKPLPQFQCWQSKDATQQESAPLALLLLGVLRILGWSWTFCDVNESTGIGRENIRQFFHVFIKWGGGDLYREYVKYPMTAAEAATQQSVYAMAGFHGAVGSMDTTHVSCDRMPAAAINQHCGYKLAMLPTRTYNLTCDHQHRILHTTRGHPATFNDKSLIRYDRFANQIKDGRILDDCVFQLKYRKASGAIGMRKFCGVWALVDNGYLDWSVTIPPKKDPSTFGEVKFSEMLESMRKDVES
jgi:Plant transposon protein